MTPTRLLLAFCVLCSTSSLALAAYSVFTDVPNDAWYAESVNHLAELKILQGNPDGTYRPEDSVNRAELAVTLDRLLEYIETGSVNVDETVSTLELAVPFTAQAPNGDWSMPYREACEEASLAMVNAYWTGTSFNTTSADAEILKILEWEEENGYGIDVGAEQIATMARSIYGLEATVYFDEEVTLDRLKSLLTAGYPVIVPTSGTTLANPNYTEGGPPYHMIVLVGYTEEGFLAHDPGTQYGESYLYSFDTMEDAIHDWNGSKSTVDSGRKAMVVLSATD